MNKYSYLKNLQNDLPSGLVVFLVAVPLCLGIALASGAPLFSGIIAGIVGGIVVASISGSQIGVSGPAAGLAVIVADSILRLGTNEQGIFSMEVGFPIFLSAVVIAGIIQVIFAFLRAGIIGYYFPNAVIKGMLAAIGIIIILKQIPHALGHDVIPEGFFEFFQNDGENTFTEIIVSLQDINPVAVFITSISMVVLILWEQKFMKKIKLFQLVQGPLVVVALGILISNLTQGLEGFTLAPDEMVSIPIAAEEGGFINLFQTPDWSRVFTWEIILMGFTIAVVASLETLLCVEATDKLDPNKNITPTNRELLAQGAGNIVSGLIGGLPITQVIVRSSANIQSGGKTKASAFFHGVLILVSVLLIPSILNMIPLSSLAAILFLVGYKLSKPSLYKSMSKQGWEQFVPFIVTIVGIIFTDLLIGIIIGLVVAAFLILRTSYKIPFNFTEEHEVNRPITITLSENVTFLNKAAIMQALNMIPSDSIVMIDASKSKYIHPDVIEIIDDFKTHAATMNINVVLKGSFEEDTSNHVARFKETIAQERKDLLKDNSYLDSILSN